MDFDMELMSWFDVEKDEDGNILLIGQETNGNTFTIRSRRRKEIIELILDLVKATSPNTDLKKLKLSLNQ